MPISNAVLLINSRRYGALDSGGLWERKTTLTKKPSKSLSELTDREWEDRKRHQDKAWAHAIRRDSMAEQGLKALLLLNGGGAVALLAFLQAIWIKDAMLALVPWILAGLVCLVLGAATSGAVHFLRYMTSMTYQTEGAGEGRKMTEFHGWATILSFVFFLLGMGIVVFGAFQNLPMPT